METFINVMKVIILALVALVAISVFLETWNSCESKEEKAKPNRKVLTLSETREALWTTYIFNFH